MDRATPGEIEAIEREQQRLCWEEVARLKRVARGLETDQHTTKAHSRRGAQFSKSISYAELQKRRGAA